jgi:hypothetical protein
MDDEEKEGSRKETKTTNGGHVVACFMLGVTDSEYTVRSNVLQYELYDYCTVHCTYCTVYFLFRGMSGN